MWWSCSHLETSNLWSLKSPTSKLFIHLNILIWISALGDVLLFLIFVIYIYTISVNSSRIFHNNILLNRCFRQTSMRILQTKRSNIRNVFANQTQNSFEHFFRYTGFRLINGYRINNRMFQFIFTLIATFSLKLFRKKLIGYF